MTYLGRLGLFSGAEFTRSADNFQYSEVSSLTESGHASGYSNRYNGDATQDGQTAWIYQQVPGLQTDFVLSTRPSDGYAYSHIAGMTVEGLAYGYYTLFNGEADLGNRAFVWSADTGALTLDEEISGGVAQYGWQNFLQAAYANGDGYVVGLGSLANGGQGVFLAQIPEPSAFLTSAIGGLFFSAVVELFEEPNIIFPYSPAAVQAGASSTKNEIQNKRQL